MTFRCPLLVVALLVALAGCAGLPSQVQRRPVTFAQTGSIGHLLQNFLFASTTCPLSH